MRKRPGPKPHPVRKALREQYGCSAQLVKKAPIVQLGRCADASAVRLLLGKGRKSF